jgi:hypothetical protein
MLDGITADRRRTIGGMIHDGLSRVVSHKMPLLYPVQSAVNGAFV